MTKSIFPVGVDATGREFVDIAVDKADKNHSSSDNPFDTPGEGALYAVPGHPLCPAATFKKYKSLLNPMENALWQGPELHVTDNDAVWYCSSLLCAKPLSDMMLNPSKKIQTDSKDTQIIACESLHSSYWMIKISLVPRGAHVKILTGMLVLFFWV